jgi:hypothetical protein
MNSATIVQKLWNYCNVLRVILEKAVNHFVESPNGWSTNPLRTWVFVVPVVPVVVRTTLFGFILKSIGAPDARVNSGDL